MNSIIGFTAIYGGTPTEIQQAASAQQRALAPFDHLNQKIFTVGESQLTVWGHNNLDLRLHRLPDGGWLALIGSPIGTFSWIDVEAALLESPNPIDFTIPWDGRVILLKISANGKTWTLWNDWLGSIPVFHAPLEQGRIAGTLEPAVVGAAQFTANNLYLPALLSLLIHGNYFSDWTLFTEMKVVPPDCTATWDEHEFKYASHFTIKPTTDHWETGWDNLVEQLNELSRQAILDVLKTQPSWIVPLSGGLDSRLIAAIGAEHGLKIHTYTFGSPGSKDIIFARQIAKTLNLPWRPIHLGDDFLLKYTKSWANLFGSAMYFHGMHQMQFLDSLKSEPPGQIVSGFLGDALNGYDVKFQMNLQRSRKRHQLLDDGYIHWKPAELKSLFNIPIDAAMEELALEIQKTTTAIPGPTFAQIRYGVLWGRQRFFTYYSSMLADYWRGVTVPFLNREYAQFCYSLPRAVLDDRRLQLDMFRRYYPKLASLSGTYVLPGVHFYRGPLSPSGSYLLKKRIAQKLPSALLKGPLQEFSKFSRTPIEQQGLRKAGRSALWPLFDAWDTLSQWFNLDIVTAVYNSALTSDDHKSISKLQTIQTAAYRLLNTTNGDNE